MAYVSSVRAHTEIDRLPAAQTGYQPYTEQKERKVSTEGLSWLWLA